MRIHAKPTIFGAFLPVLSRSRSISHSKFAARCRSEEGQVTPMGFLALLFFLGKWVYPMVARTLEQCGRAFDEIRRRAS